MKYKETPKELTHVVSAGRAALHIYGFRHEVYARPTFHPQGYVSIQTMTPSSDEDGVHYPAESTFVNLKLEQAEELVAALIDHIERMKPEEVPSGTSQTAG